jgi:hypothetical protein
LAGYSQFFLAQVSQVLGWVSLVLFLGCTIFFPGFCTCFALGFLGFFNGFLGFLGSGRVFNESDLPQIFLEKHSCDSWLAHRLASP